MDGKSWQGISESQGSEKEGQIFNQEISGIAKKSVVYLKIEPRITEQTFQGKVLVKYGLKNLKIESELISK